MKAQRYFLLALFTLSALFTIDATAQRVKPTLPEPATIEAGKFYYLYNDSTGLFIENVDPGHIEGRYMTAAKYKFTEISEGEHAGQWIVQEPGGAYWEAISGDCVRYCSYLCSDSYFRLSRLEDGCYTIQRNYDYVGTEFVGNPQLNQYIYASQTENIKWRLIPEADTIAAARRMLYHVLENIDEGYNVDAYDTLLISSNSYKELLRAAKQMNSAVDFTKNYAQRGDFPLFFINDSEHPWTTYYDYGFHSYRDYNNQDYNSTLKAVVEVDEGEATLAYTADASNHNVLNVYIDGVLARSLLPYQSNESSRYYEKLGKGVHTIQWEFFDNPTANGDHGYIGEIGVFSTPTISVNLLEPGSLGTEILAQVNDIKEVRRLKIKGEMNDEDWAKISLTTELFSVDLSEAVITTIPSYMFDNNNNAKYWLHEVLLPEGLTSIGEFAFRNSHIDNITLPSTLTSIGQYAFYHTNIGKALIPENVTSIGRNAFEVSRSLIEVNYPSCLTYIPNNCFATCPHLQRFNFSQKLETIGDYAFYDCFSMKSVVFPASLKSIGYEAFRGLQADSISIGEGVGIHDYAFRNSALKYAELPTTYYDCSNRMFENCANLRTIKFKSPTKVTCMYNTITNDNYRSSITLLVPDYLVNAYKLDGYWYNYGAIEGFATSEINTWTINNPLDLDATARLQGTPNVILNNTWLTMQGETTMEVDNFTITMSSNDYWWWSNSAYKTSSQVLVSADVDVKGLLDLDYHSYGNKWYFLSLPFDIKVGDIQCGAQYAIRYYDGANRATTGSASGNWKNYTADDIVEAGSGFIFQTSAETWSKFIACENARKNRAFKAEDLSTILAENTSETSEHRGWNLVGNPWMTWYNIHSVDFTAPITVYDHGNNNYTAYSIIDDDIALHPTQAFFVQSPDGLDAINFPARGRQLTSEIKNQNGAPARDGVAKERQLIDIQLIAGDIADKTRVVVNEKATLDYDYGKDASKFFADGNVMQLYTLGDNNISYSINERPEVNGIVNLAYITSEKGEYTLSLIRNQASEVTLTDLHTGIVTDLTQSDYIFTSEAGTFTDRFQLALKVSATGIGELVEKSTVNVVDGGILATGYIEAYALDGRRIAEGDGFVALDKGVYVVRINNVSTKVIVK